MKACSSAKVCEIRAMEQTLLALNKQLHNARSAVDWSKEEPMKVEIDTVHVYMLDDAHNTDDAVFQRLFLQTKKYRAPKHSKVRPDYAKNRLLGRTVKDLACLHSECRGILMATGVDPDALDYQEALLKHEECSFLKTPERLRKQRALRVVLVQNVFPDRLWMRAQLVHVFLAFKQLLLDMTESVALRSIFIKAAMDRVRLLHQRGLVNACIGTEVSI